MKSRSRQLVDKSLAAMISAIEIYNKPDFKYREETFSILAINAWELLLKAKWLSIHGNKVRSLYVQSNEKKADGTDYKYPKIKLTTCGNPFTHSLDFLAKQLKEKKILNDAAYLNVSALREIRDSSVHFYNSNPLFAQRLQEIGSANVKNFVTASQSWFGVDLSRFNFYLMPLAFVSAPAETKGVTMNREEKNLARFITQLEAANDPDKDYSVTVNIDFKYSRSKAHDALNYQLTNDPNAAKIQLTEQQIKDRYPLKYKDLTDLCSERYSDFCINKKYHNVKKPLKDNPKYFLVRRLDPDNPKSLKQNWYSKAILNALDEHYAKKR